MSEWITQLIEQWTYLGVALLMLLETVFPPIPSEIIMSVSGVYAAKGTMALPGVIAAGTAGAMLGNLFWYAVARALGLDRLKPLVDRFGRWLTMDWDEVVRGERWFLSHGALFVCVGRMVPTIRSLVSIPAGLAEMNLRSFLIWSTVGTTGWSAALATAGYLLGSHYMDIEDYLGPASLAVILAVLAYYLWRVVSWKPRG
ncbi:DedA family protein [uncultured Sphingomonas sp.]|uniref:DedA family protein n=1 Tax=uncultured Sphingomonas sp. TaxID=158754 RepID=UPI002607902B|nr:DedA family protein [uncultured Sphingomonas sp.]